MDPVTDTAGLHEKVCRLMRDGKPRLVDEIAEEVGSVHDVIYRMLTLLTIETSLNVAREPGSKRFLYVWNDA